MNRKKYVKPQIVEIQLASESMILAGTGQANIEIDDSKEYGDDDVSQRSASLTELFE